MAISKVIFADVDGPLSPIRCYVLGQLPGAGGSMKCMDPVAVATVVNLCRRSGARIVVSSSWRGWGKEKCLDLFARNGLGLELIHEDWATPHNAGAVRAGEIKDWLARHPEVTHYAVLDDGVVDVPNLVRVSTQDGILFEHQRALERLLGLERENDFKDNPDECKHRWIGTGEGRFLCENCDTTAAPGDQRCPWTASEALVALRRCMNDACGVALGPDWPAVYCSNRCALDDA